MSSVQRRLCAIMFSDITGYSSMMGKDEEATLALLEEVTELMKGTISAHRGTVLKLIGDAVLAVFDSGVDAVSCAISMQRSLAERNGRKLPVERVLLRIGIHIGDIVLKEGDVFGDGVNIAARIEPTTEPGGICVSQAVFDTVKDLPDIRTMDLGPHKFKNIREPVTIYRIVTGAEARPPSEIISHIEASTRRAPRWFFAVPILLAFAGWFAWRWTQSHKPAALDRFVIAVAPFSGTPEAARDSARVMRALVVQRINEVLGQETELRILSNGMPKAPQSYADAKAIGLRLKADLVIWGDVLILRNEIGISPHVTMIKPIPFVRDNDPKAIHARLGQVKQLDLQASKANELGNVALLVAAQYYEQRGDNVKALELLARISPPNEDSLYKEASIHYLEKRWPEMERALNRVLSLDPKNLRARKLLAYACFSRGDLDRAVTLFQEIVKAQPNDASAHQALGAIYVLTGKTDKAFKELADAIRLDPKHSISYIDLGSLYYKQGNYNRAADIYGALIQTHPTDLFGHFLYYLSLKKSGNAKAAQAHLRKLLRGLPSPKSDAWPAIIAYYLAGKAPEERVLELMAQGSPGARLRRECEGYFYIAMAHLLDPKDADRERLGRENLEKSLATGLQNFYEYDLAQFELSRLKKPS